MPRAFRYRRSGYHYDNVKGKVIAVPGLRGVAWYVGGMFRASRRGVYHVHLVSLPVGRASDEPWAAIRLQLEAHALAVLKSGQVYNSWQEAALAVYGALAYPFVTGGAEVERLVASIEGAGKSTEAREPGLINKEALTQGVYT